MKTILLLNYLNKLNVNYENVKDFYKDMIEETEITILIIQKVLLLAHLVMKIQLMKILEMIKPAEKIKVKSVKKTKTPVLDNFGKDMTCPGRI